MDSPIFDAISERCREATATIVAVCVTADVAQGSPSVAELPLERVRELGAVPFLRDTPRDSETFGEVLLHPEDWAALLRERRGDGRYHVEAGDPRTVAGVVVVYR